jgi:very-short-patch-repair endonuclease
MESEARLVMIDGGLPTPVLQHEVIDARGRLRRLDFAWPEQLVAAEYDSDEWHAGADALRRDREKLAALQDLGWTVVPIVADDVRRHPQVLVDRIGGHLSRAQVA